MHAPIHVCGGDENAPGRTSREHEWPGQDWALSRTRWPRQGRGKVIVDCCERRVMLRTTESHLSVAYGGYVADWRFRCAPGEGCTVNPNYKRTAHLRFYERD